LFRWSKPNRPDRETSSFSVFQVIENPGAANAPETYLRIIPPLLKTWAEENRLHGGVVFVDEKTISPADIGGLIRALTQLSKETGRWNWTNRIYFLRR
jgi:hypothetical protein